MTKWTRSEEDILTNIVNSMDPEATPRQKVLAAMRYLPGRSYESVDSKIQRMGKSKLIVSREIVDKEISSAEEYINMIRSSVSDYTPIDYKPMDRKQINLSIPLQTLLTTKREPATLAIVISDLHIGDSNHLPKTFWSTIANLEEILTYLQTKFLIAKTRLVLNGDIVSGMDVFRGQVFRNLVQKGHWQVSLASTIIKDVIDKIEKYSTVSEVNIIRGTHDPDANNYAIFLQQNLGLNIAKYHGREGIINIADPIGKYNILFTHGKGGSDYSPVSPSMTRELWLRFNQLEVPAERACVGHTHNLTVGLNKEGVIIDVCGGFQVYEPKLTKRHCGILLYLYTMDELSVTPVRPDPAIERTERNSPLEWINYQYYAERLLELVDRGYV